MIKKSEVHNILVAGKSGAGKQPRIDIIAETLNLKQLSTGTIFRECISAHKEGKNTKEAELGKIASEYMDSGKFVPDEVTNEMFEEYFKRHDYKGCVLDGYPRTVEQAKFLMRILAANNSKIDLVLEVHRDDENIISHLIHRRTCKNCKRVYHLIDKPPKEEGKCDDCGEEIYQRGDDTEVKIKSRLIEFHQKVAPMIEYLRKWGYPYAVVDGYLNPWSKERVKETVSEAMKTVIKEEVTQL